ncbi:hypothetical protein [Alloscardovia sp. HMSC034E08]|uniref:hypothetical protein n=1 Tax=Alloscardovia sp. HMSC034E08 TaxID=1739413 RepID=UPI0008B43365|nr:hypothetical protein [Alloscardovia sp. HMSC034E08]OFQ99958.1 hypothetical protein HMPREF2909_05600 [Alloscardovia sp. HMSC034E08]
MVSESIDQMNSSINIEEPKKYELVITADSISCNHQQFYSENPQRRTGTALIDIYFRSGRGEETHRDVPREQGRGFQNLVCQIFENQLDALSREEKREFPIVWDGNRRMVRGLFLESRICARAKE